MSILEDLGVLVLKDGAALGGLTPTTRALALAVPAMALAPGRVATEAEVNALLKAALADAASYLDVDHVQLRRWLVDTGWWRRDGFGRAYERTDRVDLLPEQQPIADALQSLDLPAWIAGRREARRAERAARRMAFDAGRREGAAGICSD